MISSSVALFQISAAEDSTWNPHLLTPYHWLPEPEDTQGDGHVRKTLANA